MKSTDKFLLGIVIGVVLLAAAAFGVALTRPDPEYRPDDTPSGVVHNYLLALRQADYKRAYGYLSPKLAGYPAGVDDFYNDIQNVSWNFRLNQDASVEVIDENVVGSTATVDVRENTFAEGGLFSGGQYSQTVTFRLIKTSEGWRIRDGEYIYWYGCWSEGGWCK